MGATVRRALCAAMAALLLAAPGAMAKPGQLDPSFGAGGKVTQGTDLGSGPAASQPFALADGRRGGVVAMAGAKLLGFTADGSRNRGFGRRGAVRPALLDGTALDPVAMSADALGRILVAGTTLRPAPPIGSESGWVRSLAVVRYAPNGRLDPSFGGGDGAVETTLGLPAATELASGRVTASIGLDVAGMAIDPQGRIVLTGSHTTITGACRSNPLAMHDSFVVRLTEAGELDPSFADAGVMLMRRPSPHTQFYAMGNVGEPVTDASGGVYFTTGTDSGCEAWLNPVMPYLVHLDSSGHPDPSFGAAGWSALEPTPGLYRPALALAPGARPLITTRRVEAAPTPEALPPSHDVVQRLLADGGLDRGCGNGQFRPRIPAGADATLLDLAVDRRGRALVAGAYSGKGDLAGPRHARTAFLLSRFNSSCRPDRRFGTAGRTVTRFGRAAEAIARAILVDRRGRIVVAGPVAGANLKNGEGLAIARYLPGG
jgi:uncharacterized delta-60 repeat protein